MKIEISDLLNGKYHYDLIKLRVHKKIKIPIVSSLFLKQSILDFKFIHIIYIIISSMSLLILTNDFIYDKNEYLFFSSYLRELTPFSLVKRLKVSHSTYLIICAIIFIICLFRLIYMAIFIKNSNSRDAFSSFNPKLKNKRNILIRVLNHIVYIFFSYIIEFLSFIYYIGLFPNEFIIKKDNSISKILHVLFYILNSVLIIVYNINNYIFLKLVNRPLSEPSYPIKYNFSSTKLVILIIFQNLSLVHPLQCYLEQKMNKIWCIVYYLIIFIILISLYFFQINKYNYDNIINSIISFIGEFCFVSISIELIIYILTIRIDNLKELLFFILVKLILSFCLFFGLKKISNKIMIKNVDKKIFNNMYNNQFNKELNDSILFIRELFENKNKKYLSEINKLFIEHKKNCSNNNCGCKIIILKNCDKNNELFNLEDLIIKLNYFLESLLLHFNYQKNFQLAILLSEHFLIYKDNPLMAYSILQTILHAGFENLTKDQLIIIYECMTKYIKIYLKQKTKKNNIDKHNDAKANIININKEEELSHYFNFILKIKKAIKFMINYSTEFLTILNHKDYYETTTMVKLDETFNEIKSIISPYLTNKTLNQILKFLSLENSYTLSIEEQIFKIKEFHRNLPYEFLYKIFLFIDFFWNGKIPEKIIEIFYIFNSDNFETNAEINQKIYALLENKYIEYINNFENKYYILFKFTNGIKITYLSELLPKLLSYKKSELINSDLSSLLIRELAQPHENMIKKQYFLDLKSSPKDKKVFIFDKNSFMYDITLNSTFQIGFNKNILMLCSLDIDRTTNSILFYLNRNLKIISINKNFEDKFTLTLPLIKEFKLDIVDIFGVDNEAILSNYKKETKKIRSLREYKILDTNEYFAKNLFKKKDFTKNYHILSKYIIKEKEEEFIDKDNEHENFLEENNINEKQKYKILKLLDNLFKNKTYETLKLPSIYYIINSKTIHNNLQLIYEKINSYEQDKLESKNILNDYLRLITNITEAFSGKNYLINLKIQPRVVYDSAFFLCKIEFFFQSKINEIRNDNVGRDILDNENEKFSNDNISFQNNISSKKIIGRFDDVTNASLNEEEIHNIKKIGLKNSHAFKQKIRNIKTPKYKLFAVLAICILILIISNIITFNYQLNLISDFDNIFNVIYYNYYQRAQFLALNSILLSIFYQILHISSQNDIELKKESIELIGKNIEDGRILFINSFMDFKIEMNEDFTKLYDPFDSNKITVNWVNRKFTNDYRTKTALILDEIKDIINHTMSDKDEFDCENLLLAKYENIDRENTPVNGNFIRLMYYFVINYETGLFNFFKILENSFYDSLDKFSRDRKIINISLEIIIIFFFIIFFFINIYFLIQNNKYMFKNILYIFIDFTQDKNYDFNNKVTNLIIEKKVSNFILLLKEFNSENLENLKNYKEINYSYSTKKQNLNIINEVEEEEIKNNEDNKIDNKISKKYTKSKMKKIKNIVNSKFLLSKTNDNKNQVFKLNAQKSNKYNNFAKNDIHILSNKEIKNISNNSLISVNNSRNNSRNNSTNILLDSTNNSLNNNSLISGGLKNINSTKMRRKPGNSKERPKKDELSMLNNIIMYDEGDIEEEDEESHELTIDKIFQLTQIYILKSIKIIIIIFIIFTFIFIIYSIIKLIISVICINQFNNVVSDFQAMIIQYNELIRYWNNIRISFILPFSNHSSELDETENYFYKRNNKVNYVLNNRIDNYERVKYLYNVLSNPSEELNTSGIDFCLGHKRCSDIFYLDDKLSKDIESTVNLYAKEIENYYKDFAPNKDNIKTKEDIINLFINQKFEILSLHINHVFIYIEQIFLKFFMEDEKDIIDKFHFEIKIMNIIGLCYCVLLNLFSAIFVYTYINNIIASVEISSIRINESLQRIKLKSM